MRKVESLLLCVIDIVKHCDDNRYRKNIDLPTSSAPAPSSFASGYLQSILRSDHQMSHSHVSQLQSQYAYVVGFGICSFVHGRYDK